MTPNQLTDIHKALSPLLSTLLRVHLTALEADASRFRKLCMHLESAPDAFIFRSSYSGKYYAGWAGKQSHGEGVALSEAIDNLPVQP